MIELTELSQDKQNVNKSFNPQHLLFLNNQSSTLTTGKLFHSINVDRYPQYDSNANNIKYHFTVLMNENKFNWKYCDKLGKQINCIEPEKKTRNERQSTLLAPTQKISPGLI